MSYKSSVSINASEQNSLQLIKYPNLSFALKPTDTMQQTFQQSSSQTGKPKEKESMNEKSIVVLDIKPEGTEVDLCNLKKNITEKIKREGLIWGQSKQEEIAYGIKKLVLGCVIEDKTSIEDVIEEIQKMTDVKDVDIASFNKV